jgi:hypothetical protein
MSALTLYRTAFWRLSILAVARNPELGTGQMLDELDITREARALGRLVLGPLSVASIES